MANSNKKTTYAEDEILVLEYDNDETVETGIMGVFEVNGKMYIALEDLKVDDVYLYAYVATEDGFELEDIPDEEYDAVEKEFDKITNGK